MSEDASSETNPNGAPSQGPTETPKNSEPTGREPLDGAQPDSKALKEAWYELIARKEADRGRNQALGVLGFAVVVLSLAAYFGANFAVAKYLEDKGYETYLREADDAAKQATQNATDSENILKTLEIRYAQSTGPIVQTGSIVPFAGPVGVPLPEGWLPCDGRPLSRQKYDKLFNAIKYTWGGEGDIFHVPDLQGRFLRGVDGNDSAHRDPNCHSRAHPTTGDVIGNKVGSMQGCATSRPHNDFSTNATGDHTHGVGEFNRFVRLSKTQTPDGYDAIGENEPDVTITRPEQEAGQHSHKVSDGGDEETRPINASVQWIIKVR